MTTNLTAKQQFWSEQIGHAKRNGQSLADYAKANNIPVQKLCQWVRARDGEPVTYRSALLPPFVRRTKSL